MCTRISEYTCDASTAASGVMRRVRANRISDCDLRNGWHAKGAGDSGDSVQHVGFWAPPATWLEHRNHWSTRKHAKQCGGKNGKFLRWVAHTFLVDHAHGLKFSESIFPDFFLNDPRSDEGRIELAIPVELTEGLSWRVVVMPSDEQDHQDPPQSPPLSLATLPPITLSLTLPSDYPLRRPPVISGLYAAYGWLDGEKLQTLEKTLLSVWEVERGRGDGVEGRAMLYDWVEMVRSAEPCLGVLGMVTNGNVLSVLSLDFCRAVRRFSFVQDQTSGPIFACREVDLLRQQDAA